MQLTRELQDKRLRIAFSDGEVADVKVLVVSECNEHEECRGLVYDLISTNRPERIRKGSTSWADRRDIVDFEILGD